ncbi:DUF6124 family protein [Pseudomonas gingeri]
MFKVTPNPPVSSAVKSIDPLAADRALAHYIQPLASGSRLSLPESHEDYLVSASSILESAAATAYEHADNLTGPNRKVAMGLVHLIELALRQVDSLIEELPAGVTS